MAKQRLRFLTRQGHQLTVTDDAGDEHRATISKVEEAAPVREDGSFIFGYCKSCDWTGAARRARSKARHDAESHLEDCPGKGKIRIGLSEG